MKNYLCIILLISSLFGHTVYAEEPGLFNGGRESVELIKFNELFWEEIVEITVYSGALANMSISISAGEDYEYDKLFNLLQEILCSDKDFPNHLVEKYEITSDDVKCEEPNHEQGK